MPEFTDQLAGVLTSIYGTGVRVGQANRLSGGTSRRTYAVAVTGCGPSVSRLIVRVEEPTRIGGTLAAETKMLRAAAKAGVPVPAIVAAGGAEDGLGGDYVVMEFIDGETIPRRILRDAAFTTVRPRLARQCGTILAAIHQMPRTGLPELSAPDPIEEWRGVLDGLGRPFPVLEFALRRLATTRPDSGVSTVVHGDFRNGNLMIAPVGVAAVLDWELAHIGDPMEDLGWLCAKAWRFGAAEPVGGFGSYDELIAGYVEAGGGEVDRSELHWWETFAVLRWGIICAMQAERHLAAVRGDGGEPSVELAAIGRRVCENEWDLLHLL